MSGYYNREVDNYTVVIGADSYIIHDPILEAIPLLKDLVVGDTRSDMLFNRASSVELTVDMFDFSVLGSLVMDSDILSAVFDMILMTFNCEDYRGDLHGYNQEALFDIYFYLIHQLRIDFKVLFRDGWCGRLVDIFTDMDNLEFIGNFDLDAPDELSVGKKIYADFTTPPADDEFGEQGFDLDLYRYQIVTDARHNGYYYAAGICELSTMTDNDRLPRIGSDEFYNVEVFNFYI